MKVLELFAGIGACSKALTNLGIEHEIVDAVEIDKYAIKSFNAIHGTDFEPQDITKWDKDIECDLIMHGSPCQDFSVAGKGAGGDKDSGTRSSLMYETLRIVEKLKPKYVIWENVKNLLSKKHRHNFDAYLEAMERLGYTNFYQVLNAKDYGIPQNRERVFTVSILGDGEFDFPEPEELKIRLKDVLDKEVDEKFYLDDKLLKTYQRNFGSKGKELKGDTAPTLTASMGSGGANTPYMNESLIAGKVEGINGHDYLKRVYDPERLSPTLPTMQGGNQEPFIVASRGRNPKNPSDRTAGTPTEQRLEPKTDGTTNTITSVQKDNYVAIRTANKKGYDLATDGDGVDLAYPNSATRRGRVGHGVSKTLACGDTMGVYQNYRIRKLTPKECWRLMGFDDSDFEKAEKVNSNSQLYKQAGNSIVVDVLEKILFNLLEGKYDQNIKRR